MPKPQGEIHPKSTYVLGCDLARMGEDSSVFIIIEEPWDNPDDNLYVVYIKETKHKLLTDAIGRIKLLDKQFNFRKIYIDSTGLGSGVTDVAREELGFQKVEEFNFSNKSKQGMYSNLLMVMERRRLKLPPEKKVIDRGVDYGKKLIYQLLDLRYEILASKKVSIHHSERGHDDYPDALALACLYWQGAKKKYVPVIG